MLIIGVSVHSITLSIRVFLFQKIIISSLAVLLTTYLEVSAAKLGLGLGA
jgi:hypothetical protein